MQFQIVSFTHNLFRARIRSRTHTRSVQTTCLQVQPNTKKTNVQTGRRMKTENNVSFALFSI